MEGVIEVEMAANRVSMKGYEDGISEFGWYGLKLDMVANKIDVLVNVEDVFVKLEHA